MVVSRSGSAVSGVTNDRDTNSRPLAAVSLNAITQIGSPVANASSDCVLTDKQILFGVAAYGSHV